MIKWYYFSNDFTYYHIKITFEHLSFSYILYLCSRNSNQKNKIV